MNIIKSIPGIIAVCRAVPFAHRRGKIIDAAFLAGDDKATQKAILDSVTVWSGIILDGLKTTINVIHPENLPKEGPVVYISNHQSYMDILTFFNTITNHEVGFIAKDTFEKVPWLGKWTRRTAGIFLRRGDARASLQTINEGVALLNRGFSLIIFPEGTRSQGGDIAEFKPGSFKLATKAKVPIVPVTMEGGYEAYEKPGYIKKGATIDFLVHPPVETAGLSRQELSAIPDQVEATIRQGLTDLRAARAAGNDAAADADSGAVKS